MTTQSHPVVLVGVDGSAQSLAALDVAADEAVRRHQPLRMICADPWEIYASALFAAPGVGSVAQSVASSQATLDNAAAQVRTRHPNLETRADVIERTAASALITESAAASVLVVG